MAEALSFNSKNILQVVRDILPLASQTFLQEVSSICSEFPELTYDIIQELLQLSENQSQSEGKQDKKKLENFMKIYKNDPWRFFEETTQKSREYNELTQQYLKGRHRFASVQQITQALKNNNYNLYKTHKELKNSNFDRSTRRPNRECPKLQTRNRSFLEEVFLIEHEQELIQWVKENNKTQATETQQKTEMGEARKSDTLVTCACCYDDEVLLQESVLCDKGHTFCKDCIKKSSEIVIVEGKTQFKCIADCDSVFNTADLREIIPSKLFEKYEKRKQLIEIKEADISGLVFCPFCDFGAIVSDDSKTFHCISCSKPSCLKCKRASHEPIDCEEAASKINIRLKIEEELTEKLVRECGECKQKFIRIDGCNKMVCVCGAKMCYVCRQPIRGYGHFNTGQKYSKKCPLYTANSKLHYQDVVNEAKAATAAAARDHPELAEELKDILKGINKRK